MLGSGHELRTFEHADGACEKYCGGWLIWGRQTQVHERARAVEKIFERGKTLVEIDVPRWCTTQKNS